jgi:hypothetical protein
LGSQKPGAASGQIAITSSIATKGRAAYAGSEVNSASAMCLAYVIRAVAAGRALAHGMCRQRATAARDDGS